MKRINKVAQLEKSEFVSQELFRLIQKLDDTVTNVIYQYLDGEEMVYVQHKDLSRQRINVTADSLGCIAIEVIKKVIY
jgi:hypothetical protein